MFPNFATLPCVLIAIWASINVSICYSFKIPADSAIDVIWAFPNLTWIENLAVRRSGSILCTSLNRAALYSVNPFSHAAVIVHQFDASDGLLGITEIEDDVFVVASANVNLTTSTAEAGSAKIWKVDFTDREPGVSLISDLTEVGLPDGLLTLDGEKGLILLADAAKGIVWRVDIRTGHYAVAIQDPVFTATNKLIPLGIDGIHKTDHYLYFTNLGNNLLGRVAIAPDGSAVGPIENITSNLTFPDDFALTKAGTAYIAGDNTLSKVSPNGTVVVLSGGPYDPTLEGCISAQFGRTGDDKNVLYIARTEVC
ncbi:MAG: hypothetical protein M1820_007545 [Bogoriella megaspora]|nr:MAG: hypothetical protein M1820_007545 [Bogoriella megaspora]